MNAYDVYIAYVSWSTGGKDRPVLVLEDNGSSIKIFSITTRYIGKSGNIRDKLFKINDLQQAGLNQESYIDTNTTITLPRSSITHHIGNLAESDVLRFIQFLKK